MICKNCGNEMEENAVFCNKCGKRIEAEDAVEAVEESTVETVEDSAAEAEDVAVDVSEENTAEESSESAETEEKAPDAVNAEEVKPKKKRKWIKWAVIGVVVALLAGVVAFAHSYITNGFWRTVLSEEAYFKHVIKNNISEYAESMAEEYAHEAEIFKNGETIHSDVKVEVGQKVKDLVSYYGDGFNIDWFESIDISAEGGIVDGGLYTSAGVKLNNTDITGLNVVIKDDGSYLDLPGLSDGAIRMDPYDNDMTLAKLMAELYEIAPDEKVLKELVVRYVMHIADCVEEVSEENETVEAGDVSAKYLKMTAKIDENVTENAIISVLSEAKTDADIKKIIVDYCNTSAVDEDANAVYKEFQDGIDELLSEIDITGTPFTFDYVIWVDSKGSIVGMGIDFEDGELYYVNALNIWEKKLGTKLKLGVSGGTSIVFEGSGKLESDKFNGDYNLKVMGMSILDVKLKNLDYSLMKNNVLNGQLELALSSKTKTMLVPMAGDFGTLIADAKIAIDFKTTEKYNDKVEIAVLSGSDELLTVTGNSQIQKAKLPDVSNYIDYSDFGRMDLWGMNIYTKLVGKLQAAGVPLY